MTKENNIVNNPIKNNLILTFNNIHFENVSFKYKKNNHNILNNLNLNLNLEKDKIIGFVGLSGQGKSTIAKLLVKMYSYEGNIYIDNININKIDSNYIRKNIIYINQNSKLFDKKIIDNILYGCKEDDYESCYQDLEKILESKKIKELYKNISFDKKVGFSGENISGGQRQVINIINGLIIPSKIVIIDEPTNGLDIELKKEVIRIIKYFKQYKKSIIIISHDKDIYDIFDETININININS
jgi:ABC-type bacteriocin/lantibiotic exporter with double-glycine peptidase domain